MLKDQINIIKKLAEPIVQQEDMFIVDVEIKGGNETVVWIFVDSEHGDVSVDSCTRISSELDFVLDAHEVFSTGYRLNISSPGLSRPLSDRRQYVKNLGRKARVKFKEPEGYRKLEGILSDISGDEIKIEMDKGDHTFIDFNKIVETKIIPTFSR
ncbi:MAG: ribosome maturation factor RimP [Balneolaceae bacterium]